MVGPSIVSVPKEIRSKDSFRLEVGFGWASLAEDPDVGEGFGGGIYASYEIISRFGLEASLYFSKNPYDQDALGNIGRDFLARVREEFRRRAFPVLAEKVTIDYAELGGNAGFIGAAGCARRAVIRGLI